MRKKILIYGFISSVIAVVLTGIIAFFIMQSSILGETKLNARSIANMVINDINSIEAPVDYDLRAKTLGKSSSDVPYRITIIAEDGIVLGDSDADIHEMDNHAERPEIVEANIYGFGSSRRYSATLNMSMQYVAVKDNNSDVTVRVALPLTDIRRMSYNLLLGCLLSIIAGGLVSIIASIIFSKSLSMPIGKLAIAANELAKGNMAGRVEFKTNTEIDKLAEDFNIMADNLEKVLHELKHRNQEFDSVLSSMEDGLVAVDKSENILYLNPTAKNIFGLIGEQSIKNAKLSSLIYQKPIIETVRTCLRDKKSISIEHKMGREEILEYRLTISPMLYKNDVEGVIILLSDITHMKELEKMRTDFVANVSHELRTPLTSIKGYSEALRDDGFKDHKQAKRFLEIIEIESDRLNVLINDLMELSKIENKSTDTNISVHDFDEIVNETAEIMQHKAENKKIEMSIKIEKDLWIIANKDRIKQVLLNLIDNGIKYNHPGGDLFINAYSQDNWLVLSVRDSGEGIDSKDLPRLFERFYRVEKSRSKELGGTGLGLSIVKHIAELYGGSVVVHSEKGVGSEFIVKMPIVKV